MKVYTIRNEEGKYLSMGSDWTDDWFKASKFPESEIENRKIWIEVGCKLVEFKVMEIQYTNQAFIGLAKNIMESYITNDETYDSENEFTFNMHDVNLTIDGVAWHIRVKDIMQSYGYNVSFTFGDGHWTSIINSQ